MQKYKRILSVFLSFVILAVCTFSLSVEAAEYPMLGIIKNAYGKGVAKIYSLAGTTGHEAMEADKGKSELLCELSDNETVKVLGEALDGDGDKWYKINYGASFENEGYAYSPHVILQYEYQYDEDFEENLENFPESYRDALRNLHAQYPNWRFIAANVDMTFDEAVDAQYSPSDYTKNRKYITFTYGGNEWRDMRAYSNDVWDETEQGWTYASRAAIAYYMDPRNFLTTDGVFMFAQQSYSAESQTKELLRKVVKGNFLENGYDVNGDGTVAEDEKDAYLDDIMYAAEQSRVSAYVIAAMIIAEQPSSGDSPLISGTYSGYEGYYNFFNVKAYGETHEIIYANGLSHAVSMGWNSRRASIVGGAEWYEDGYIGIGQDTYYFMDFNVVNKDFTHQYATNIRDAYNKGNNLKDAFVSNLEATVEFKIPVFSSMPDTASPNPSQVGVVYPDTGTATPPPAPEPPKGDTNWDNTINAVDLASVKMHILGVKYLEGDGAKSGDVNGDGAINAVDLAAIKMHILGVKAIS